MKRIVSHKLIVWFFCGFIIGAAFCSILGNVLYLIKKSRLRRGRVWEPLPPHPVWDAERKHSLAQMNIIQPKEEVPNDAQGERIVCWVTVRPSHKPGQVQAIKDTWARRCHRAVFTSTQDDDWENNLWEVNKTGFKFFYDHLLEYGDWFLRMDSDSYVVMENLRHLVGGFNSSQPLWLGSRTYGTEAQPSSAAGYVLSKEAVKRIVEEGFTQPEKCQTNYWGDEDSAMGECLRDVGITLGDSRDEWGRDRFFRHTPLEELMPGLLSSDAWPWYWGWRRTTKGLDCCSSSAVSFHGLPAKNMLYLEYMLYHLHPHRPHMMPTDSGR